MTNSLIIGVSQVQPTSITRSDLEFESSDVSLVESFHWAKGQSMAYVFDSDPVGPWYEAAEPGREAFCIRDVTSQSVGAHALVIAKHNINMLKIFAQNISDSRDWCSYWEIDRYNRPAPVDYKSDAEFWYCLPANFDILDFCFRQYLWTGDRTYVEDPVFLNFYDRTVTDYVERWGLDLEYIMKRPRLMNIHGVFDPNKKFQRARGIPGYDERNPDYVLSAELLASMYAGYLAYAHIQEIRRNEELAQTYFKKALEVKNLVNNVWWNGEEQYFYKFLNKNYKLEGRCGLCLLNRDVVDDELKIKSALKDALKEEPMLANQIRVAQVLFKYGEADGAISRMLDVALGSTSRREYPEVSFTWIEALVTGLMGVSIGFESPILSSVKGDWVETIIKTLPGLGAKIDWAELRNLPIRANKISIRHEGIQKTVFINQSGPALIWQATFPGSFETLLVNDVPVKTVQVEKKPLNKITTSIQIVVGAGGKVCVEAPK